MLVTTSYVIQETVSLLLARHGLPVLTVFHQRMYPGLDVVWVERALHERAVSGLFAAARRQVSLTDWVSFEVMRERGITRAFAYDEDFAAQGFELVS